MTGKQNILITGANGYLGSHISELLSHSGHNIYALCLEVFEEQKHWETLGIKTIQGDITKPSCLDELDNYSFDTIIHMVSLNHFDSEKNTELALKVNVLPTWNLLKQFSAKGLKKFIYFSTQQVYGRIPAEVIDELFQPSPVNSYGLTHLQSEQIVNLYKQTTGVDAINIRLSNSYGAPVFKQNSCWWLVVNDLCKSAYENKKIKLLSDGSPQRDFIHVQDVANAVKVLVENNDLSTNLFHLSSGKTYSILELAVFVKQVFKERYNEDIPIVYSQNKVFETKGTTNNNAKFTIDNSQIKNSGLSLQIDLYKGIDGLFNYLESNSH